MISEKEMENSIISDPEKYLGETGLKLLSQQHRIGNYVFDILLEDRHGAKMIVELQKGTLDRTHTYKILDYYHEYKENNPSEFIELMVIANKIPDERKKRLSDWGVSYKEIPVEMFIDINAACKSDDDFYGSNQNNNDSERRTLSKETYNDKAVRPISDMPTFMVKFQHAYDNCDLEIRNIFNAIVKRFGTYSITHKSVNRPDYRFSKKHVFCCIIIQRKCLLIEVRVDDYHLSSKLLTLDEHTSQYDPGKRWLHFRVMNGSQTDEVCRLIDEVYKFSP